MDSRWLRFDGSLQVLGTAGRSGLVRAFAGAAIRSPDARRSLHDVPPLVQALLHPNHHLLHVHPQRICFQSLGTPLRCQALCHQPGQPWPTSQWQHHCQQPSMHIGRGLLGISHIMHTGPTRGLLLQTGVHAPAGRWPTSSSVHHSQHRSPHHRLLYPCLIMPLRYARKHH